MEAMSTSELILYKGITFLKNLFDIFTPKKWCPDYMIVGSIHLIICQQCILYYCKKNSESHINLLILLLKVSLGN